MSIPSLSERAAAGSGPLSTRYDEAVAFAAEHHRAQLRKGSMIPYLSHLMSVSALVLEGGGSEDAAIAGLLHDAVEDAPPGMGPATLTGIRERFGEAVAHTVRSCSDGLNESGERSGTWAERKIPYIESLAHKTLDAALVTAADKTHNARCITNDVRRFGEAFWATFNACPHQIAWYYASVRAGIQGQLAESPLLPVLDEAVTGLLEAAGVREPQLGHQPANCSCA